MVLFDSKIWGRFCERQAQAPPLLFDVGWRHLVPDGNYCPFHSHHSLEIVYHRLGHGVTTLAGRGELPFGEGSAVVYAPEESHDQKMVCEGEDLCINILLPPNGKFRLTGGFCVEGIETPSLIHEMEALASRVPVKGSMNQRILSFRATAVLLALIQLASRKEREETGDLSEEYARKADGYIREHFEKISSLAEVAAWVGISHDHLRHIFKAKYGKTLIQHLNDVRVERAKSLLIYSRLPMKQIARMCGFSDEYYFSTVFQKHTRLSPGSYRRDQVSSVGPTQRE